MTAVSPVQLLASLATSVTASAKAGSELKDFPALVAETRKALDALLNKAGVPTALKSGKPTIDLTSLDRRQAFAIAVNGGGKFTSDEQAAAALDLHRRFGTDLVSAASAARFSSGLASLFDAGGQPDASKVDSRWLSAMALSRTSALFEPLRSNERADRNGRNNRSAGEFLAHYDSIASGRGSSAFLGSIDAFASSGPAGWNQGSYVTALQNYQNTSRFAGMLGGGVGAPNLLDFL